MTFKKIQDGQPITSDTLNRLITNSGQTWVASTTFSGTNTYNIDNVISNTAGGPRWTRVVISNLVPASATALFIRAIDSIGTVVATNNYQIGYYGANSSGGTSSNWAVPTSVWNLGEIGGTYPANYTMDFYHNGTNNHGISMFGTGQGGTTSAAAMTMVNFGGWCNYNTRPIRGINLVSYLGVNFSGKINVYQYRRA